jgi:hypothetical protein
MKQKIGMVGLSDGAWCDVRIKKAEQAVYLPGQYMINSFG